MEIAIPLLAMGGLYLISNQSSKSNENFENRKQSQLPNVNIPDKNYPSNFANAETDTTSKLSVVNKYDTPSVYTDKYFNSELNKKTVKSYSPLDSDQSIDNSEMYYSLTGQRVDRSHF